MNLKTSALSNFNLDPYPTLTWNRRIPFPGKFFWFLGNKAISRIRYYPKLRQHPSYYIYWLLNTRRFRKLLRKCQNYT